MNGKVYLKERLGIILTNLFGVLLLGSLMVYLKLNIVWIIGTASVWILPLGSYMLLEYIKYNHYYKELQDTADSIRPRYLLAAVMSEPEFEEGRTFYEVLKAMSREMHEKVKDYEVQQKEYKEYIESWIHEIKTPIASAQLIIENNPNHTTYKLEDEIRRIEGFVEQALYYARSNEVSQDYLVKSMVLRECVMEVVKANARDLIQNHIALEVGSLDQVVQSDSKWVAFILGQLITNSIKYAKDSERQLRIDAVPLKNKVVLSIEDNGIGIDAKDIRRVWEKGFTGQNGRKHTKSTGLGLYLCKKLCDRLGIGINITSQVGEGTTVQLVFPVGSMTKMDD
ncbi:MAG: sensor histidine kinase [Cellulosilyticaceae bacterium]